MAVEYWTIVFDSGFYFAIYPATGLQIMDAPCLFHRWDCLQGYSDCVILCCSYSHRLGIKTFQKRFVKSEILWKLRQFLGEERLINPYERTVQEDVLDYYKLQITKYKTQINSNKQSNKQFKMPKYDLEERTFKFAKRVRYFVKTLPKTIANIEDPAIF